MWFVASGFAKGDRVRHSDSCRSATVHSTFTLTRVYETSDRRTRLHFMVVEWDGGGLDWVSCRGWVHEYVVETAVVASIQNDFIGDWRVTRPMKGSGHRPSGDVEPVNPYAWLADETGLSPEDLYRARNPDKHPWTPVHVADAITAAVGHPELMHDGTVEVVEHPCCAGSKRAA